MHSADVIRMLEEDGWLVVRAIAPNLSIFHHPVKSGQVMLPHPLVLPVGTVQSIRNAAGLA
jgi:predicted RNA binding protein YcfA (HicA-like mRNA interferase family)